VPAPLYSARVRLTDVPFAFRRRLTRFQALAVYRLILLGGGHLQGPDGPVAGRAARGYRLALIAMLAVEHPRPLTREKVIGRLWPESDTERGRRLLRQTLHVLRGTLGDAAVLSSGDDLRLAPERLSCDLWEFRTALEHGDPDAAAGAYAGPFLDGVFVRRAAEFERWVETERAQLTQQYAETLEAIAERRVAAGDVAGAAAARRRLAELDPYHSRYALRLVQALVAAGDRAGALRHAAVHSALLQTDLGVEPDPEVAALAERLREPSRPSAQNGATQDPEILAHAVEETESLADEASPSSAELSRPSAAAATAPGRGGTDSAGAFTRRRWLLEREFVSPRARPLVVASVLLFGLLVTLLSGQRGELGLALLGIRAERTLLERGVLGERERIVLADFASATGDTVLAHVVTEALRIDIAQSPVITLVDPRQVRGALRRMHVEDARPLAVELAREVAVREGIKAVLAGEIARTGSGYLLSAQLLAAETGEILAAQRETTRDSTGLLPALDRLSRLMRRRIGESLRSVDASPPLAQVTTPSLAALQSFTQAVHLNAREGESDRVIALLEDAIRLDTTFSMAYRSLGNALGNLGEQRERQLAMLRRAYQYRDRLPDRERHHLLASYYDGIGEPEKSVRAMQTLLATYPHDGTALANVGAHYATLGDYARAEELTRRALAVDSSGVGELHNLLMWEFNQGKAEEAGITFGRLRQRFSNSDLVGLTSFHFAAARGHYAAAEAHTRAESIAHRGDLMREATLAWRAANLAAARGRLRDAERYATEAGELRFRRGLSGEPLQQALHLAHLELSVGRSATQALARAERLLESHPLASTPLRDRPLLDLAALHARAGNPARARTLKLEWEAAVPMQQRYDRLRKPGPMLWGTPLAWVLGEIALAEGDPEEAVRHFRRANEGGCLVCALPHLGRAFEAAGQPDSAISAYERFLHTPFFYRIFSDAHWRATAVERLGRLHEARGDHTRAAEYYRSFIDLWQDADPELQPRVREARRRLATMEGDGE
jgi:DNA-binding SARP family transcriptional activator/tetratricopeptide (TPR) repeat protein/TolB-like protein